MVRTEFHIDFGGKNPLTGKRIGLAIPRTSVSSSDFDSIMGFRTTFLDPIPFAPVGFGRNFLGEPETTFEEIKIRILAILDGSAFGQIQEAADFEQQNQERLAEEQRELEPITQGEPITQTEPIIEIEPDILIPVEKQPISLKQLAVIGGIALLLI